MAKVPSKFTKANVASLCQALEKGCDRVTAYRLIGISHTTFYEWLDKHPDFADAVAKSEAKPISEAISAIVAAFSKDWRSALAFLERRGGEAWRVAKEHVQQQQEAPTVGVDPLT